MPIPIITNAFPRMMARHNRWQNAALFAAADTLTDAQRREAAGAFWGSIHGTLAHLHWADSLWMSRLGVVDKPVAAMKDSPSSIDDWSALSAARRDLDDRIVAWADALPAGPIEGELSWYSGVLQRDTTAPLGVLIPHIFNHQTHHRGQAHAMITARGGVTTDTDLFLMPRDLWPADWAA